MTLDLLATTAAEWSQQVRDGRLDPVSAIETTLDLISRIFPANRTVTGVATTANRR